MFLNSKKKPVWVKFVDNIICKFAIYRTLKTTFNYYLTLSLCIRIFYNIEKYSSF